MTSRYQLADTITETLVTACESCNHLVSEDRLQDALSILNEWKLNDGSVVMTHFLNETTGSIRDRLMYVITNETSITEGTFWFDPEVELPTDNI